MEFKPIFEAVASETGAQTQFFSANVDSEAKQSAVTHKVQSLPTVVFFANGKEVNRIEGGMTRSDFLGEISRAFSGSGVDPSGGTVSTVDAPSSTPVIPMVLGGLALTGVILGAVYLLTKK